MGIVEGGLETGTRPPGTPADIKGQYLPQKAVRGKELRNVKTTKTKQLGVTNRKVCGEDSTEPKNSPPPILNNGTLTEQSKKGWLNHHQGRARGKKKTLR